MSNSVKLTIRISETDMALLKAHTKATGYSQSAYLCMLIRGVSPKAPRPARSWTRSRSSTKSAAS